MPANNVWHTPDCTINSLLGIKLGDIGAKFSITYSGNDNGFMMFDHVRIPLNQMLMGLAKVGYSMYTAFASFRITCLCL